MILSIQVSWPESLSRSKAPWTKHHQAAIFTIEWEDTSCCESEPGAVRYRLLTAWFIMVVIFQSCLASYGCWAYPGPCGLRVGPPRRTCHWKVLQRMTRRPSITTAVGNFCPCVVIRYQLNSLFLAGINFPLSFPCPALTLGMGGMLVCWAKSAAISVVEKHILGTSARTLGLWTF